MYAVTSVLFERRTRATFLNAELGFLGVMVLTIVTTPRLKGFTEVVNRLSLALKEAADSQEPVFRAALVIPKTTTWAEAGSPPAASVLVFSASNAALSIMSPGRRVVSPWESIRTLSLIRRTITSKCLS